MFLHKLRVMNLWNEKELKLDFSNQVTVLTGVNGSGKSSILNIIYDSLNMNHKNQIATSKNRLWVSECVVANWITLQTMILPPASSDIQEAISDLAFPNKDKLPRNLFEQEFIEDIKSCYDDNAGLNHVTFSKKNVDGQGYIHGMGFPKEYPEDEKDLVHQALVYRPNAFLFQEDRKVIHNLENSNVDLNLEFWETYSTSIDTRFFYIRDAMQIKESQIDAERSEIFDKYEHEENLESLRNDPEYKDIVAQKREISELYSLLNRYFLLSDKEVVKDKEDNKITLKHADSENSISWHLLSRGEKTLIYLFFATYLYKDKVGVFLLDEPDVALHVDWQKTLISDLVKIAPDNQFIIATHSPSLVMSGWMPNCLTIKV